MTTLKTYPSTKDKVAELLYANQSDQNLLLIESSVINHMESLWFSLSARLERGDLSKHEVEKRLLEVDAWLKHRLTGATMHALLLSAEVKYPQFVQYMPETLASRYEEIRVARIWSSLFDPETLIRLRTGIEFEKNISLSGDEQ